MPCSICKLDKHNARSCPNKPVKEEEGEKEVEGEEKEEKEEEKENKDVDKDKDTKYYCYFLGQPSNWQGQTYNGYTVNLKRRLRQHNGEIKGGAWATTAKGKDAWTFIAILHSPEWNSIAKAMQIEWLCRYPTRKKPRPQMYAGAKGRISSLVEICKRFDEQAILFINPTFYEYALSLGLPGHVTITNVPFI